MKNYLYENRLRLLAVGLFALCLLAFGAHESAAGAALAGGMLLDTKGTGVEAVLQAFQEQGAAHKSFAEAFTKRHEKLNEDFKDLRAQLIDLCQKVAARAPGVTSNDEPGELANLILASDGAKAYLKGATRTFEISVPSRLLAKTQIINATGQNQPLVPAYRQPGIAFAPPQRLTIRGLFNAVPVNSNLIEIPQEASYTSNARPQGDTSPGGIEGELKAESAMTFTLATVAVPTIAHWIPASRQVLSDAPALQAHIESRLLYGLALEEEREMLTGDGTAGAMNGLNNRAAAYNGGVTNDSRLDTLAKGANQLAVANYEPTGFVLHPTDWLTIRLLKDTTGRYLLGDPAEVTTPQLWGLPVVPTASQTLGRFTVLDARRTGYVADREEATIRISENVNDYFIRNMIAILAEERAVLVVEDANASVYGQLSQAG